MSCSVTPWASIERGVRASYTHGMRLSRFLLSLAVFSGVPAGAQQSSEPKSLMYTTVHLDGDFGGEVFAAQTRYIRGRNERFEGRVQRGDSCGPLHAYISNHDLKYRFDLDFATKTYVAVPIDDRGQPVTHPGPVASEPSGRTQRIQVQTIDTGKRRTMFGYAARRVIIRQTTVINPPGDSSEQTLETVGWYIDLALEPRPSSQRCVSYVGYGGSMRKADDGTDILQIDDVRVTCEGPVESGFPLARKTAHDYERVIEISERPLDPALFLPPWDFKRVQELPPSIYAPPELKAVQHLAPEPLDYRYPFSLRVRLHWLMLRDWLL